MDHFMKAQAADILDVFLAGNADPHSLEVSEMLVKTAKAIHQAESFSGETDIGWEGMSHSGVSIYYKKASFVLAALGIPQAKSA